MVKSLSVLLQGIVGQILKLLMVVTRRGGGKVRDEFVRSGGNLQEDSGASDRTHPQDQESLQCTFSFNRASETGLPCFGGGSAGAGAAAGGLVSAMFGAPVGRVSRLRRRTRSAIRLYLQWEFGQLREIVERCDNRAAFELQSTSEVSFLICGSPTGRPSKIEQPMGDAG